MFGKTKRYLENRKDLPFIWKVFTWKRKDFLFCLKTWGTWRHMRCKRVLEGSKRHEISLDANIFIYLFFSSVCEAHLFRNVSLTVLLNHFHFLIFYLLTLFIFFISHVLSCNTHLLQKGKSVWFSKNQFCWPNISFVLDPP